MSKEGLALLLGVPLSDILLHSSPSIPGDVIISRSLKNDHTNLAESAAGSKAASAHKLLPSHTKAKFIIVKDDKVSYLS